MHGGCRPTTQALFHADAVVIARGSLGGGGAFAGSPASGIPRDGSERLTWWGAGPAEASSGAKHKGARVPPVYHPMIQSVTDSGGLNSAERPKRSKHPILYRDRTSLGLSTTAAADR